MVAALAAAAGAPRVDAQPATTLTVGLPAEAVSLDAAQVTDPQSPRVARRIAETLVTFAGDDMRIVPALAESWTVSPDGLAYTFALRRGIAFHDGTPLTAAAVKFSIERQILPDHPAHRLGRFPLAPYVLGNVKAVAAVDDVTVRFSLAEPRASFLAALASPPASIVSPAAVRRWGTAYGLHPVGTGPLRFASWDRGGRLVLEKNPAYWQFPVKVDQVVYRPVADDQARLTALLEGRLDVALDVPPESVAALEGHPRVELLRQTAAHVWYLGINNQKKPFDDRRVRQALNYAVDKEALVRGVLRGTAVPSRGPVPPGTWGAEPALKVYPHDPERARRLLAEAGLPRGFSASLWVPDGGAGMQSPVAMAAAIQSDLRAVGITLTLQIMQWSPFLVRLRSREQDLFALSWLPGSADPDAVLFPLLHSSQWTPAGPNRALYRNERFDALIAEARRSTDVRRRAELYRDAQRLLAEDAPWVFVCHEIQVAAVSRRVRGVALTPGYDLHVETASVP